MEYKASVSDTVQRLAELCHQFGLSVGAVESCTGGLIAKVITDLPGSSAWFCGGLTTYSNALKNSLAKVPLSLLEAKGAVSSEVALEMVLGGSRVLGVDCCMSVTGVAGPDGGTEEHPLGTVYIGVQCRSNTSVQHLVFTGDRQQIRQQAAETALSLLEELIKKNMP